VKIEWIYNGIWRMRKQTYQSSFKWYIIYNAYDLVFESVLRKNNLITKRSFIFSSKKTNIYNISLDI